MATIRLPNDFKDFLKLLESTGARYLIVGGYAVNVHGYSRSTGDIDVWVPNDSRNGIKVAQAVAQFGFPQAAGQDFASPGQMVRMGHPPMRVEILTTISGVSFDDCFARRIIVAMDGICVPFLSLEDLKTNKIAAGRLKDLADLEEL